MSARARCRWCSPICWRLPTLFRGAVLGGCLAWIVAGGSLALDESVREPRPNSWRNDAQINDVFFLDQQHGWAVGDQGLILRTIDGGQNWKQANTSVAAQTEQSLLEKLNDLRPATESHMLNPLRCRMDSVHFIDAQTGWIAGSYQVPYMNRSRAVILKTQDGGLNWKEIKGTVLPRVARIEFQDANRGWAVGDAGNLYKSGVFYTMDGGQSWTSEGAKRLPDWRHADRIDVQTLVTVSRNGNLGVIRGVDHEPSVTLTRERPFIRSVRMMDEQRGWAVGDRGVVLMTRDGGTSWSPSLLAQDNPELTEFDFDFLVVAADKVWFGGSPGTCLFSIDTKQNELQKHSVPSRAPLKQGHFVSEQRGWVVGSLGTILATQDGGATWNVQRQGASRVGFLAVAENPRDLPLDLIAVNAGEENVITAVVCLRGSAELELASAAGRIGCSIADHLPPREQGQTEDWGRQLVAKIRMLQPNVIAVNGVRSDMVARMRRAIEAAADPDQYPGQLEGAELPTWRVDRLVFRTQSIETDISLDANKLLPRTGQLLGDYLALSRAHLGLPIQETGNESHRYRYENQGATLSLRNASLFADLRSTGKQVPVRNHADRMGNLRAIQRASTKQRQFQRLLDWQITSAVDHLSWRQQLQSLGMGLEPAVLGVWLTQLSEGYLAQGQMELAAETLEWMASQHNGHPLTAASLLWLAQYYGSDEFHHMAAQRIQNMGNAANQVDKQKNGAVAIPRQLSQGGVNRLVWTPVTEAANTDADGSNGKQAVQTVAYETNDLLRQQRLATASRYLDQLRRLDPDLAMDNQVKFLEAQLTRQTQGPTLAKNHYQGMIRAARDLTSLALGASRELKLMTPEAEPATDLVCHLAGSRPRLDGKLDDSIWQAQLSDGQANFRKMLPPEPGGVARTDVFLLAYDDQFLFIAARCNKVAGHPYTVSRTVRKRDDDLTIRDRLRIVLDIDRDYRSAYEFSIDYRGWGADRLGGAAGWDAEWFIAQSEDDHCWMIEAAIPLSSLFTDQRDLTGRVMAINVSRLSYRSEALWELEAQRNTGARRSGLLGCLYAEPRALQLVKFQ